MNLTKKERYTLSKEESINYLDKKKFYWKKLEKNIKNIKKEFE